MNELLVLLLPLAAFSGWWLARSDKKNDDDQKEDDYFKGLSYLLEDETDKAIDIFFRIAHLDDSTIENQITLGNLFRHRGEIDRALHIHSNLLNKSELASQTQQKLNLSLADDYLAAGIMNLAEEHYQSVRLSNQPDMRETARRKLINLYAEQSLWSKALEVVDEIDPLGRDKGIQQKAAHFHCELARLALDHENITEADERLHQALACDKHCVRATIKLGRLEKAKQNTVAAIDFFQQVEQQNPSFLPEIMDDLQACYQSLNQHHEWKEKLTQLANRYHNPVLILRLQQLIAEMDGDEAAKIFLQKQLQQYPNMLAVQAYLKQVAKDNDDLQLLGESVDKILSFALKYRCRECGFRGNQLNWQCPGCKHWGTFTPVSDVSIKENIA